MPVKTQINANKWNKCILSPMKVIAKIAAKTGTKFVYNSGVISDTSLEPGYSANYEVHVQADSSLVRYVTREIKWDVFE